MKKAVKRLFTIGLAVCMCMMSVMTVFAGNLQTRASYLIRDYDAYVDITSVSGELIVCAEMNTVGDCDELEIVYLDLYEQQDNGQWLLIDTWSTFEEDNDRITIGELYEGEIGYSYKVEAEFRAKRGSIEEIRTAVSEEIVCQ